MREAVLAYAAVAARHGLTPLQLAIRFVLRHPCVASVLTGATSVAQLRELLEAAVGPPLSEECAAEVEAVHARWPNPTP